MANYANLLATIAANIYTNGNNEVTAAMVKAAVDQMVASLGAGYQFMGVATPATTPGNTDIKQFYIASEPGTYTNFGGLVVNDGEVAVLKYDTAWSKMKTNFLSTFAERSHNLFDKDAPGIQEGHYLTPGGLDSLNPDLAISDYIPVTPNVTYHISKEGDAAVGNANMALCAYKADKTPIIYLPEHTYTSIEPGSTTAYIRFSYRLEDKDTIQVEVGKYRSEYRVFNEVSGYQIGESPRYSLQKSAASVAPGSPISFDTFPDGLKLGNSFSAFLKIPNGIGNGVLIGWGYQEVGGTYLAIDSTSINVYKSAGSEAGTQILAKTIAHGLTLSTFLSVVGLFDDDAHLHLSVQSLTGSFDVEVEETAAYDGYNEDFRGTFVVQSLGSTFTDVVVGLANSKIARPIWIFGDSYMTISDNTRVGYYLHKMGVLDNCLVQAFGGEEAKASVERFIKAISFSRPKYVLFAVGMNGAYHISVNGYDFAYASISAICDALGIELILYAPPVPSLAGALPAEKVLIDNFVRSSGRRYIDAYAAVGSDDSGNWYGQGTANAYQAGDGVHTSILGAKAIAKQFLLDFPELMNGQVLNDYII